jgi:hypothetical protein
MTPEDITARIQQALPDADVQIVDTTRARARRSTPWR